MSATVTHHAAKTSGAKLPNLAPLPTPLEKISMASEILKDAVSRAVVALENKNKAAVGKALARQINIEINEMQDGHRKGADWAKNMRAAATEFVSEAKNTDGITKSNINKKIDDCLQRLVALNIDDNPLQLSWKEATEHKTDTEHALMVAALYMHWSQEG